MRLAEAMALKGFTHQIHTFGASLKSHRATIRSPTNYPELHGDS